MPLEKAKSITPTNMPNKKELKITISVESTSSCLVVQETFFISAITSLINFLTLSIIPTLPSKSKQAWQESNLQRTVLETVALPIGATGLNRYRFKLVLLLCLFVWCTLTTMSTKFLNFQAFWVLFFIFSAVVIDTVAHSALKMNCLAHIYFRFLRSPDYSEIHDNGVTEDLIFKRSPRAVLNRWPRPYQGRALPTELQGQRIWPPAAVRP